MCLQQLECLRQWGKCLQQWGNVHNSGEIEYALKNVRLEIVIDKSA